MISLRVASGIKNGEVIREVFYFGGDLAVEGWAEQEGVTLMEVVILNGLDPIEKQEKIAARLLLGETLEEIVGHQNVGRL